MVPFRNISVILGAKGHPIKIFCEDFIFETVLLVQATQAALAPPLSSIATPSHFPIQPKLWKMSNLTQTSVGSSPHSLNGKARGLCSCSRCSHLPPSPKHKASGHVAENHPRWFSYRSMPVQVLVLLLNWKRKKR